MSEFETEWIDFDIPGKLVLVGLKDQYGNIYKITGKVPDKESTFIFEKVTNGKVLGTGPAGL